MRTTSYLQLNVNLTMADYKLLDICESVPESYTTFKEIGKQAQEVQAAINEIVATATHHSALRTQRYKRLLKASLILDTILELESPLRKKVKDDSLSIDISMSYGR
jgi:hypothetical protein